MNFKRKKCKRQVRCTICTKYRWSGNSTHGREGGKYKVRDRRYMTKLDSVDFME